MEKRKAMYRMSSEVSHVRTLEKEPVWPPGLPPFRRWDRGMLPEDMGQEP